MVAPVTDRDSSRQGKHSSRNPKGTDMYTTLRKRLDRSDEGFTLIELLIVVAILGTLAAIVIFAVGSWREEGKTAACSADQKTVSVAAEAYKAKTGSYPADLAAVNALLKSPVTGTYSATSGTLTSCTATP